jgi:hypothetical protein
MQERRAFENDIKLPAIKNPKRRSLCLTDPRKFFKTYFRWIYPNPFTRAQNEVIDAVLESAEYGTQKAIAYPRGDGKTKITEGVILFATTKGFIDFSVPIAVNDTFSLRILDNIKKMVVSPIFVEDFPEIGYLCKLLGNEQRKANSQTVGRIHTEINWTNEYLQFPTVDGSPCSGSIIYPLSITGAIRGLCIGEKRPNFLLFDDPETEESAREPKQVAVREKIINNDCSGLKGPDGKLGMVALVTIQGRYSLAAKLTDRKIYPAWGGIRRGLIEKWPARRDLWENEYFSIRKECQENGDPFAWKASEYYLANQVEMDRDCVVSNPYRFNNMLSPKGNPIEVSALQACMNFIADKGIESFMLEYQNDTSHTDEQTDSQEPLTARIVEARTNGYEQGSLPAEIEGVTLGLDVGKRYCHWTKIGWQANSIGMIVDYGVVEVNNIGASTPKKSVERSLIAALHDFRDNLAESDYVPDWSLIDSSDGVLKDAIYQFVRESDERPQFAAAKGYGEGQGPKPKDFEPASRQVERILGSHWYTQLQENEGIWLYHPDANYWKRWVHERFSIEPFDSEGNQVPNTLTLYRPSRVKHHASFSKHIVAEEYRESFDLGLGVRRKFVQVSPNNHWLDATYMACAAAAMQGFIQATELQSLPEVQQSRDRQESGKKLRR